MGRRKYCSAQPYLDYIGVPEKERRQMTEPKSKCCGADIEIRVIGIEYDHDDMPIHDVEEYCPKCNKPCTVRKEEE